MSRIYLDYAASTPVRKEVLKEMLPYFSRKFGNPGSLHSFGQEAMAAIDESREKIARVISADFREVIFTGSATEANNLALRGVVGAARLISRGTGRLFSPAEKSGLDSRLVRSFGDRADRAFETFRSKQIAPPNPDNFLKPKVIVSAIEHESVLDTAYELEREGVEVVALPVDKRGIVDLKKLEKELDERTILVSIMYVNNEIGTVEPISEIAKIIRNFRNSLHPKPTPAQAGYSPYPLFHTDAAQAFMYLDCDVNPPAGGLGVDLMTLSGQKIYGPKGIGALYVRGNSLSPRPYPLDPIVTGGGQEFGLRSGTENTPLIIGFGKAVELASKSRNKNRKYVESLKKYFWSGLKKINKKVEENSDSNTPHILNVYFPDEYTGDLLVKLDMAGVAASAGSACSARAFTPSHVLHALGFSEERVRGSVRFSFGITTTKKEIDEAIRRIRKIT